MKRQDLQIRDELPADHEVVYQVIRDAFEGRPYAGGDEQDLVNVLRDSGSLTVALVAELEGEIIGHIAFSPATASDGTGPWFTLGPVAVRPDRQMQGIGGRLISEGLEKIRGLGALGCILTGNPVYYRRFGFEFSPPNVPEGESEEFFMVHTFAGQLPGGPFRFDEAFYA
jgi:putative acetyltransferase